MIQISSNLNYNITYIYIYIYIYIILHYRKYIAIFNMFNFIFIILFNYFILI